MRLLVLTQYQRVTDRHCARG